jgi:hypothetical protein
MITTPSANDDAGMKKKSWKTLLAAQSKQTVGMVTPATIIA